MPQVDPVLALVVGAFGAALLTAVAGAIGALVQGKREHARWVREQRFDAYRAYLRAVERMPSPPTRRADFEDFSEVVMDALADIGLVGPSEVMEAAMRHEALQREHARLVFHNEPQAEVTAAHDRMQDAFMTLGRLAQKHLGIRA